MNENNNLPLASGFKWWVDDLNQLHIELGVNATHFKHEVAFSGECVEVCLQEEVLDYSALIPTVKAVRSEIYRIENPLYSIDNIGKMTAVENCDSQQKRKLELTISSNVFVEISNNAEIEFRRYVQSIPDNTKGIYPVVRKGVAYPYMGYFNETDQQWYDLGTADGCKPEPIGRDLYYRIETHTIKSER